MKLKWIPKPRQRNKPRKLNEVIEADLPADPVSEDLGRQHSIADVLGIPSSEGMEGGNGSNHKVSESGNDVSDSSSDRSEKIQKDEPENLSSKLKEPVGITNDQSPDESLVNLVQLKKDLVNIMDVIQHGYATDLTLKRVQAN